MTAQTRPDAPEALTAALRERVLVVDGAVSAVIQRHGLSEEDHRGERFADWGRDVLGSSGLRTGRSLRETERWLSSNLAYEPGD